MTVSSAVPESAIPDHIDLHNMTVQSAHRFATSYLDRAARCKKQVRVITGKSGIICREFPLWMETRGDVKNVAKDRGGGSYLVKFK